MGTSLFWSLVAVAAGYFSERVFTRVLQRIAARKGVDEKRVFYISRVFTILFVTAVAIALLFIWSVDIKSISLIASSAFAVIGVALFAQWSILSNVTASIIIFFNFPARVGDRVRIIDGENSIEGTIREITLFQVELLDGDGHTVFYPNSLLLQRPVLKLKR
jgi:small-conductance mechanosensitive channel